MLKIINRYFQSQELNWPTRREDSHLSRDRGRLMRDACLIFRGFGQYRLETSIFTGQRSSSIGQITSNRQLSVRLSDSTD